MTDKRDTPEWMGKNSGLSPQEVADFLSGPVVARVATIDEDGYPYITPVWQEWDGGRFRMIVSHGDVKAAHVRARPEAAIVVAEHTPPYRGVEAHGAATLRDEDYPELAERMVARYLAGVFPPELDRVGHVLTLEPARFRAWSFADWYGATS